MNAVQLWMRAGVVVLVAWATTGLGPVEAARAQDAAPPATTDQAAPRNDDLAALRRRRAQLAEQLAELDEQIAAAAGAPREADDEGDTTAWQRGPRWRNGPPRLAGRSASREDILAFLDEHLPELAQRVRTLETDNPQAAERLMRIMEYRRNELLRARRYGPEFFELKLAEARSGMALIDRGRELTEALAAGAAPERLADIEQRLRAAVSEHIDIQLRVQQRELELLEARVESLRARIEDRQRRRQELVEELMQLVRSRAEAARNEPGQQHGPARTAPPGRD